MIKKIDDTVDAAGRSVKRYFDNDTMPAHVGLYGDDQIPILPTADNNTPGSRTGSNDAAGTGGTAGEGSEQPKGDGDYDPYEAPRNAEFIRLFGRPPDVPVEIDVTGTNLQPITLSSFCVGNGRCKGFKDGFGEVLSSQGVEYTIWKVNSNSAITQGGRTLADTDSPYRYFIEVDGVVFDNMSHRTHPMSLDEYKNSLESGDDLKYTSQTITP